MKLVRWAGLALLPLALVIVVSCGGDSSTDWLNAFANGLSVASPTAASSRNRNVTPALRAGSTVDGTKPLAEKASTVEAVAKGTATGGCAFVFPNLNGFSARATCFGPNVDYTDHQSDGSTDGQLPGGDLGIWEAAESNGDACAAAQLNKLIATTSAYVDTAIMMEAAAICTLNDAGESVPGVGDSAVDFASSFQSLLQADNPSATVTTASASTPADGINQFEFAGTTDGSRSFYVLFRIKKTSDTVYQGRVYGYFEAQNKDAFSVTFKRADDSLNVRMLAGAYQTSTADSDVFTTDGDLNLDDGKWMGNMNQAILSVSASTGTGNVSFAWQAGNGDDKTRVFNVYATGSSGSVSGCGFAGYGADFSTTLSDNTNSIQGFICNWAGPGNDHSMSTTSGKAQKQCFSQSGTVMSEVTAKRAITYAPTVSCNDTSSMTYDWPAHSGDGATNDLITLSSDTDYTGNYTAPTAPTLDSGI